MSDNKVLDLFDDYQTLQEEIKNFGAATVLDDLYKFYPAVFVALEEEFKKRQKQKELGVLLAKC